MGYPINILSGIKSILSRKKASCLLFGFLYREKPAYKRGLPKSKGSPTVRVLSLSLRNPLVSLELMKNRSLLSKYRFGCKKGGYLGKKKTSWSIKKP